MRRRLVSLVIGDAAVRGSARRGPGCEPRDRRSLQPRGRDLRRRRARRGQDPGRRQRLEGARATTTRATSRARSRCAQNGRFEGLVDRPGARRQRPEGDRARARRRASVTVTNHPNGGPVFSGPQVQPWACQATAVGRAVQPAGDLRLPVQVPTTGQFAAYDPASPPSDVATTTTDQGKTVPYIVRVETGYQDRDQYTIAVLYDPSKPFAPWSPQDGWNHKLLITHGASCGIDHQAGTAPDVVERRRALARLRGDVDGAQQRRPQLQPRHPGRVDGDGEGAPGRAVRRDPLHDRHRLLGRLARPAAGRERLPGHLPGDPARLQLPGRVDARRSSSPTTTSCAATSRTRRKWGTGVVWDPLSIAAVEGHPEPRQLDRLRHGLLDLARRPRTTAARACRPRTTTTPQTNPGGVRCTLADYMINVFGPRPSSALGPAGAAARARLRRAAARQRRRPVRARGAEERPDHAGAVRRPQRQDRRRGHRHQADAGAPQRDQPALARAYRSGGVNSANNLDQVAIIDLRGPDPGAFHDAYRSWAIRARLEREHGTSANQVIWFGAVPLMGDPNYANEGLVAMDRWLAAVEADGAPGHARAEDHPRPAERRPRPLLAGRRPRAGQPAGRRHGLRAGAGADQVRHAAHGRRRGHRDRHQQVHAEAAAAHATTTRSRSPTRSGRSSRRRSRPASATGAGRASASSDTIPWQTYQTQQRRGDLRRPAARRGPGGLGRAAGRATRSLPGAS